MNYFAHTKDYVTELCSDICDVVISSRPASGGTKLNSSENRSCKRTQEPEVTFVHLTNKRFSGEWT